MLFFDLDKPNPQEIKKWMEENEFSIKSASDALGVSKRQFSRFLSGETEAKRVHSLAMQMIWLINENKKNILDESEKKKKGQKFKKDLYSYKINQSLYNRKFNRLFSNLIFLILSRIKPQKKLKNDITINNPDKIADGNLSTRPVI